MNRVLQAWVLSLLLLLCAGTASAEAPSYTATGSAEVVIQRPSQACFDILTDIHRWPKINLGVTRAIDPPGLVVQEGSRFRESISSPIPGFKDWTTEWTVQEFQPGRRFVIAGLDHFASVPIHSRITYTFTPVSPTSTRFKRSIDVSIDEAFVQKASRQEVEALYRFLGSQWEMATHLKTYIESQP